MKRTDGGLHRPGAGCAPLRGAEGSAGLPLGTARGVPPGMIDVERGRELAGVAARVPTPPGTINTSSDLCDIKISSYVVVMMNGCPEVVFE